MDLAESLRKVDALFAAKDFSGAQAMLVRPGAAPRRNGRTRFALIGGGLVEDGALAGALGRALVRPLERAMIDAKRLLVRSNDLPDEPDVEPSIAVGDKTLSEVTVDAISGVDVAAVRAWRSLDFSYAPAVTT